MLVGCRTRGVGPAARVLILPAFFDRTAISEFYFEKTAMRDTSRCPRWLLEECVQGGKWNGERLGDLISELAEMGLVERSEFNKKTSCYEFSLHPLVQ
jgi:hypothetical protein